MDSGLSASRPLLENWKTKTGT